MYAGAHESNFERQNPSQIDPLEMDLQQYVIPAVSQLGLTVEQVRPLLALAVKCAARKREDVWRYANVADFEAHIQRVKTWAKQAQKLLCLVGIDLRNIGGLNEQFGETKVNEFIDALIDLIIASARELCAAHEGAEWQLFHYGGGDEYMLILVGIDEFRLTTFRLKSGKEKTDFCHDITRAMDRLTRRTVRYSISRGLDLVPHPKYWWRIQKWGTGVFCGLAYYDPRPMPKNLSAKDQLRFENVSPNELLTQTSKDVHACKRGMEVGANGKLEIDPLELSIWQQLRRMWHMPRVIAYKLFNMSLGLKLKDPN